MALKVNVLYSFCPVSWSRCARSSAGRPGRPSKRRRAPCSWMLPSRTPRSSEVSRSQEVCEGAAGRGERSERDFVLSGELWGGGGGSR